MDLSKKILTNEDPYDENPRAILDDIERGFSQAPNPSAEGGSASGGKPETLNPQKILDRREAIHEALRSAKPGDTVVITGKGAERFIMGPNSTKISWDDREIVREELEGIGK